MGRMKGAERGWRVSRMKATRDVFELNKFLRALSVDKNENLVTASERNVFRDFLPTPPFTFSRVSLSSVNELIIYVMPFCLFITANNIFPWRCQNKFSSSESRRKPDWKA